MWHLPNLIEQTDGEDDLVSQVAGHKVMVGFCLNGPLRERAVEIIADSYLGFYRMMGYREVWPEAD